MSYPYIAKRVVNAGTDEEPDFKEMPFLTWIPGKDRGPYKQCRTCRELRDAIHKKLDDEYHFTLHAFEANGGLEHEMQTKAPKYPPFKVGYSIPGSANCAKHIIRFHKKNGTWTEELEADVLRRELINEKSRKGAYFNES